MRDQVDEGRAGDHTGQKIRDRERFNRRNHVVKNGPVDFAVHFFSLFAGNEYFEIRNPRASFSYKHVARRANVDAVFHELRPVAVVRAVGHTRA